MNFLLTALYLMQLQLSRGVSRTLSNISEHAFFAKIVNNRYMINKKGMFNWVLSTPLLKDKSLCKINATDTGAIIQIQS